MGEVDDLDHAERVANVRAGKGFEVEIDCRVGESTWSMRTFALAFLLR